jgi:hypothetical protein
MKKILFIVGSHMAAVIVGIAAGIYLLPILTAPDAPRPEEVRSAAAGAEFTGEFRRDLKDSDLLHWGEGTVSVGRKAVALMGRIAPGPAYKLYLTPEFVETKADFLRVKERSAQLGDVKTFENFIVAVPDAVDVSRYNSVVVWCESFSMFITAAKYR